MRSHVLLLLVFIGCREAAPREAAVDPEVALACAMSRADSLCDVALLQLLARPLLFRGRHVATQGYAVLRDSLSVLYLSAQDPANGYALVGVALTIGPDSVARRLAGREGYVTVVGRYDTLPRQSIAGTFFRTGIQVKTIRGVRDSTWGDWIDPTYQPKVMH